MRKELFEVKEMLIGSQSLIEEQRCNLQQLSSENTSLGLEKKSLEQRLSLLISQFENKVEYTTSALNEERMVSKKLREQLSKYDEIVRDSKVKDEEVNSLFICYML